LNKVQPRVFLDPGQIFKMLEYVKAAAIQYCKQHGVTALPPIFTVQLADELGPPYYVLIAYKNGDEPWTIWKNEKTEKVKQQLAAENSRQNAELQYSLQQQQKQAVRAKIIADLGAQQPVNTQELSANPFLYKGSVVAVPTTFMTMMSESDAMFRDNGNWELFVSGVPTTLFRGGEQVILGVRVVGTKGAVTPGGQTLPSGEYVGVYKCLQYDCNDYWGR
jgi:hypothetical protein